LVTDGCQDMTLRTDDDVDTVDTARRSARHVVCVDDVDRVVRTERRVRTQPLSTGGLVSFTGGFASFAGGLASTPASLRCCGVIGAGAPVSGS
jgi:hypothetical protein